LDYFLDIVIKVRLSDTPFILSKVYRVIHGIISNGYNENIGVAFPDWTEHHFNPEGKLETKGTLGNTLRLFGAKSDLIEIRRNPALDHYAEIQAILLHSVSAVPNVERYVRFVRDRRMEKNTKGFQARRKRRNQKRGNSAELQATKSKPCTIHYLTMMSKENGRRFSLFIRREPCEQNSGIFSRYGLSKNNSSVCDF
jgi:CRISPR-associated endoribonuclease Cas6/Csy4 subtype I-F